MAKKEEAQLILKIKTAGKESIDAVSKGFDGLKDKMKTVTDVGKTLAIGITGIVTAMGLLTKKAGEFEQVEKAFQSLSKEQGVASKQILKQMRELTDGMVSDLDLMVAANKASLLGLPLDSFPQMLKIAKSASEATGESMQFMLDSIVVGLGRQSKLILDNLGILIDTEKAYDKYADTLGKTADQLTEAEKKQAFINEAVRVGAENADKVQGSTDNAAKAWARFKAAIENVSVELGTVLTPVMLEVYKGLISLLDLTKDFVRSNYMLTFVEETIVAFKQFSTVIANTFDAVKGTLTLSLDEANEKILKRTEETEKEIQDIRVKFGKKRLELVDEENADRLAKGKTTAETIETERLSVQERILKEIQDEEKNQAEWEIKLHKQKEEQKKADAIAAEKEANELRMKEVEKLVKEREKAQRSDSKIAAMQKIVDEAGQGQIEIAGPFLPGESRQQAELEATISVLKDSAEEQSKAIEIFAKSTGLLVTALENPAQGLAQGAGMAAAYAFGDPALAGPVTQIVALLTKGPEAMKAMVDGLVDALPDLIVAVAEALPALIIALAENMDRILLALVKALPLVLAEIIRASPEIVQAIAEMLMRSWGEALEDIWIWLRDGFVGIANTFGVALAEFFEGLWIALRDGFVAIIGDAGRQFFDTIAEGGKELITNIGQIFETLWENIATIPDTLRAILGDIIAEFGESIADAGKQFGKTVSEIFKGLVDVFENIDDVFIDIAHAIWNEIEGLFDDAFSVFNDAVDRLFELPDIIAQKLGLTGDKGVGGFIEKGRKKVEAFLGLHNGGFVPGVQRLAAGGTVDTVNTKLTPGEFVVNRGAAMANASLLQSINNGQQPMAEMSGGITIVVNGGLLGDEATAREFARAVDREMLKLRQGNESLAFDSGIF